MTDAERMRELAAQVTAATDADLLQFGYAPGGYMNKCRNCTGMMFQVDKRCYVCRGCALAAWNRRALPLPEGAVAGGVVSVPRDLLLWVLDDAGSVYAAADDERARIAALRAIAAGRGE